MPEEGSGAYSWALPVTLSGLLKQARVNALTTEDLAALLKKQGLRDLGNGLPQKWDEAAVKAASSAGQVSKETGYVLLASWNTNDPRDKWGDDTQFWLEARLQQGDRALFDTTQRPPRYYRLADYDAAVRDLAEMVLATVNPGALAKAKESDAWAQRVTLDQVKLLAEAERDVAAGKLVEAGEALSKAQASVQGREGAALAQQRLLEVNEALRKLSPALAQQAEDRAADEVLKRRAARVKEEALDDLTVAEDCRFHDKWREAAPQYFLWVRYVVKQQLMQPGEICPEALRDELKLDEPAVWDKVKASGQEAQWWSSVALALYRGGSGALAAPLAERAEECAKRETDDSARADALEVLAAQAGLRSAFLDEERDLLAAVALHEKHESGSVACAKSYDDLAWMYRVRGDLKQAAEWYETKAMPTWDKLPPEARDLDYARACNGLGSVYYDRYVLGADRADLDLALQWFRQALTLREDLAPGSLECAKSYNNMALTYLARDELDEALTWHMRALAIREKQAPGALDCAQSYSNLGVVCGEKEDYEHAVEWYQKALAIYERLSPGSLECAGVYANLGDATRRSGDADGAVRWYQMAAGIQERLAPGSAFCARTYRSLGDACRKLARTDEALDWYEKAKAIEKLVAGSDTSKAGRDFTARGSIPD
jgi:tetratricopeptide (TPR) repeat protein